MVGLVVGLVRMAFRCCFLFLTGLLLMGATSAVLNYFPNLSMNSALAQLDTSGPNELISDLRQSFRDKIKNNRGTSNVHALIDQASSAMKNVLSGSERSKSRK